MATPRVQLSLGFLTTLNNVDSIYAISPTVMCALYVYDVFLAFLIIYVVLFLWQRPDMSTNSEKMLNSLGTAHRCSSLCSHLLGFLSLDLAPNLTLDQAVHLTLLSLSRVETALTRWESSFSSISSLPAPYILVSKSSAHGYCTHDRLEGFCPRPLRLHEHVGRHVIQRPL